MPDMYPPPPPGGGMIAHTICKSKNEVSWRRNCHSPHHRNHVGGGPGRRLTVSWCRLSVRPGSSGRPLLVIETRNWVAPKRPLQPLGRMQRRLEGTDGGLIVVDAG